MQTLGEKTLSARQAISPSNDGGDDLAQYLNFLSNPKTTIPLNSNFLISFDIPQAVKRGVMSDYEQSSQDWNTQAQGRADLIDIFNTQLGFKQACVFANGVVLPQERYNVERKGNDNAGLVNGLTSTSRNQQGNLKVTFLETNLSFIDFVMRNWVILSAHYGLIARSGTDTNIKTTITAIFFDRFLNNKARKVYRFYGAQPVGLSGAYATHDFGDNKVGIAEVEWSYNYYTVSSGLDR